LGVLLEQRPARLAGQRPDLPHGEGAFAALRFALMLGFVAMLCKAGM